MNPGDRVFVKEKSDKGAFYVESITAENVIKISGSSVPVSADFGEPHSFFILNVPENTKNGLLAISSYNKNSGNWSDFLIKLTHDKEPYIHFKDRDERWFPPYGVLVQIADHQYLEVRIGKDIFTSRPHNNFPKGKRYISDAHKLCCLLADCEDAEALREELDKIANEAEVEISAQERVAELEAQLEDKEQLRLETNIMLEATGDQNKKRAAELVTKDKLIVLLLTYVNSCQSENLFLLNELEKISDKADKHIGDRITTIRQLLKEIDLKKMIRYATQRGSEIQDIQDRVEK